MTRERTRETAMRARRARRRWVLLPALFWGLVIYAIGFGVFAVSLPKPLATAPVKADAIVALTGDGDRLGPAVMLLEQGGGKRLLITGVNKVTSKRDLKALLHGGTQFDCCADLGFAAADTRGNAEEAARWVRSHNYRSLVVVTADYHMPRSLVEFGAKMPDVALVPYPVTADATSWQNLRRLHGEYAKYLASVVRVSIDGLVRRA
jgi:uncharacterized SAM-binding protein YcdF (DUF218 family)